MRLPEPLIETVASLQDKHRLLRAALLLAAVALPSQGRTEQAPLPLIENIRELHCAADETATQQALERLKNNLNSDTGLPDEWEGRRENQQLHAGTIDLAIDTTIQKIQQFPSLTSLGESVLLQWNYCEVFHDGVTYDLHFDGSELTKDKADYQPPRNWTGLSSLGLGHAINPRYIPQAFSNTATTARGQVLYNWWNLQRHQCLPHPGNGQMFHRKQYVARARVSTAKPTALNSYPLVWSNDCTTPFTEAEHQQRELKLAQEQQRILAAQRAALQVILAQHRNRELAHYHAYQKHRHQMRELAQHAKGKAASTAITLAQLESASVTINPVKLFAAVKPQTGTATLALATNTIATEPTTSPKDSAVTIEDVTVTSAQGSRNNTTASQGFKLTAEEAARNAEQIKKRIATYREQLRGNSTATAPEPVVTLHRVDDQLTIDTNIPEVAAALPDDAEATPPVSYQSGSVPPFKTTTPAKPADRLYHGLSGSFALSNRSFESDAWSLTANFSYKPIIASYFFARSGFTVTEDSDSLSYYWGIGYNDWHTDTWAFELNNWGPLRPGDGLKVEKAIASLSYKFDSELLKKFNLSSSVTLSAGKDNSPSLTIAGTWAPKPNWFVRNLITQSLDGGDATWAYGFGYNDWRSNTWSLEYNNWGPNTLSAPNFKENALITLSWKWNL